MSISQTLSEFMQRSGVAAQDAERVAQIALEQSSDSTGPSAAVSELLAIASTDDGRSRLPGPPRYGNVVLKRGVTAINAWPSKWQGPSLKADDHHILTGVRIRGLVDEILSRY